MSERNEPVDPRHEEALAAALHAHAETVRPAGDGLIRIRARAERRRTRSRFLIPVATAATVAAAVTAVVATGLLAGPGHKPDVSSLGTTSAPAVTTTTAPATTTPATSAPSSSAASTPATVGTSLTTTPSPSATSPVVAAPPPGPVPVWPFADKAAADAWQATAANAATPWQLDPKATAERFVGSVLAQLHLPKPNFTGTTHPNTADGTATVDVSRVEPSSGKPVLVGTVRLSRWSTGGAAAPWGVVGMSSASGSQFPLTITSPAPGATVGAPLPVVFNVGGAEDDVYVGAAAAGGGSTTPAQHVVTGVGATATIRSGLPASGRGYVVVADGSSARGSFALSRLAVTPVQFGAPTYDAPTYVAVVGHELRVLDAATNAEVHPLAGNATGVTQVAVSDDRQWVYYLQGATNGCGAGTLMRTRLDGTGTPTKVDTGTGPVTAFAIAGPHAQQLAYATTPCATDQVVHWQTTSGSGQITGFTKPPQAELLALSPDGSSLAGYIKISMQGDVETFALPGAHSLTDGVVPSGCTTAGNSCISAAYASNGDLVYVRGDGQQLTVFRQHGGTTSQLFHVAGAYGGTVDVDPTGTKVLLTDGAAHAWSWTDGGIAQALPGSITDASW